MLVRSWNLFHGNTLPPGRRSRLEEMVRLASSDQPDVLCLQEVPLWSLSKLPRWSGMTERHVVARPALLGAWLGGMITRLNNGRFRSALSGQANAILLTPGLEPLEHRSLRIDERRREPRYCHAVKLDGLVVGNLHATNDFRRPEAPCAEIVRAEAFVTELAEGLPCVLAGDFNVRAEHLHELPGWSALGPGHRPRPRARDPGIAARRVAARAPSPDRSGALRSRSGRGHDRMTPAEARALFPVLERIAYLNAGTFGPLARPTAEAVEQQLRADLELGRIGQPYFDRLQALRAELRAALAELVHVEPEHVSLTSSTTDGCNIVLAGLDLGPDDEIVITGEEHFGLTGPVHASGARVVVADADPEAILAAVTPRTRLLAISQVLWTSGRVLPVHELRERSGVPVLVDGAQSVGAIPVDANGLDFLTISGQKWLCGPDATGALVIADPERLRVARPSFFSQTAHESSGTFEPVAGRCPLRSRLDPARRALRASSLLWLCRPTGASSERGSWRRAAGRCWSLTSSSFPAARRSSRSARRIRPRSSLASRRPTSQSARSRPRDSSASRAGGGRTRTTSRGSSTPCNRY